MRPRHSTTIVTGAAAAKALDRGNGPIGSDRAMGSGESGHRPASVVVTGGNKDARGELPHLVVGDNSLRIDREGAGGEIASGPMAVSTYGAGYLVSLPLMYGT